MSFQKKNWLDRVSEYPLRRTLTKEGGGAETVTVARDEGLISVEGDAFNAANMNGLESRIADALEEESKTGAGTKFTIHPVDFISTTVDSKSCHVAKVNLTAIYCRVPEIGIAPTGANTIPTEAERESFGKVTYASVDDTTLVINLYASELPAAAFGIVIKGVE